MNTGKKGIKNILWGIVAQVVTIGLGIFIPRLVLVNLGSEANGLLNSVSSILTYLGLLEAGVGTVSLQALYQPLAENDHYSVNRIVSATHYFYKRSGTIYLCAIILMSVLYALLTDTTIPRLYVFFVVFLSGLSGVLSYFFQGKYRILLIADGKSYVTTNITTITTILVSISKAALLILGFNVVAVQAMYFIFNFVQMLIIVIYVHRHYRWLDLKVEPNFEATSQKGSVVLLQIASLVFYNTDVVILTIMTSLKIVSVYSMYAMIFGMVKSLVVIFSDSYVFALGQAYKDKNRFMRMFNAYEVYNTALTFSFFCVAGIMIIPFMKIYTSGVNDINYVDLLVAVLFIIYYLMDNARKPSGIVINIAKHFKQTRWRGILEAAINLVASIVLTYFFGIYGVLLGTIVALLYRANDMILYSSKLLNRSPWITYKRWLINIVIFIILYGLSKLINVELDNYITMIIYGIVCSAICIPVFVGLNSALEPKTTKFVFGLVKKSFLKKRVNIDSETEFNK